MWLHLWHSLLIMLPPYAHTLVSWDSLLYHAHAHTSSFLLIMPYGYNLTFIKLPYNYMHKYTHTHTHTHMWLKLWHIIIHHVTIAHIPKYTHTFMRGIKSTYHLRFGLPLCICICTTWYAKHPLSIVLTFAHTHTSRAPNEYQLTFQGKTNLQENENHMLKPTSQHVVANHGWNL
mgnify:CR=1 FL=1